VREVGECRRCWTLVEPLHLAIFLFVYMTLRLTVSKLHEKKTIPNINKISFLIGSGRYSSFENPTICLLLVTRYNSTATKLNCFNHY
jgi:hypothetical protein